LSDWTLFGPEIKRLRDKKSIKEVAELAGIDRGHLSRLERSKHRPSEHNVSGFGCDK